MPKTYTVKEGDSWAKIAGMFYGNQRWYEELAGSNSGIGMLQPGQTIVLPDFDTDQDPVVRYDPESLNVPATDLQGNEVMLMGLNPFNKTANQILRDYWGAGAPGTSTVETPPAEAGGEPTVTTGNWVQLAQEAGYTGRAGITTQDVEAVAAEAQAQAAREDRRLDLGYGTETVAPPPPPDAGNLPEGTGMAEATPGVTPEAVMRTQPGIAGPGAGVVTPPSGSLKTAVSNIANASPGEGLNMLQNIEDAIMSFVGGKAVGLAGKLTGMSAEALAGLAEALGINIKGDQPLTQEEINAARQATPVTEAMEGPKQVTGIPGLEMPDLAEAGGLAMAEGIDPYVDNAALWFDSMPTYGPDSNIVGPVAQSYAELYLGDRAMWASWYPSTDASTDMAKILEGISNETWDMGPYAAVYAMREYITKTGVFPSIMANLVKRGLGFNDEQMDKLGYVQDPRGFWVMRQDDKIGTGSIDLHNYPNLVGGYYNRTFSRRGGVAGGGRGGNYSNYNPATSINWRIGL